MNVNDSIDPVERGLWERARAEAPARPDACPAMVTLAAWVDGRLNDAEREAIEEHLAGCGACLAAVVESRAARAEALEAMPLAVVESAAAVVRGRLRPAAWRVGAWVLRAAAAIAVCVAAYRAGAGSGGRLDAPAAPNEADVAFGLFEAPAETWELEALGLALKDGVR